MAERLNNQQLAALRSKLPINYGKKIAQLTGMTRVYVYQVANGKAHNDEIMSALLDMANENVKRIRANQKRLEKISE